MAEVDRSYLLEILLRRIADTRGAQVDDLDEESRRVCEQYYERVRDLPRFGGVSLIAPILCADYTADAVDGELVWSTTPRDDRARLCEHVIGLEHKIPYTVYDRKQDRSRMIDVLMRRTKDMAVRWLGPGKVEDAHVEDSERYRIVQKYVDRHCFKKSDPIFLNIEGYGVFSPSSCYGLCADRDDKFRLTISAFPEPLPDIEERLGADSRYRFEEIERLGLLRV